jgi:mannitol-1-phosphate 5-dehydrogenase
MSRLRDLPAVVEFARRAAIDESGAALIARYRGLDPLFSETGFRDHVDDLIERMLNPYLVDRIERVARDPARKLGWGDRLVGTMRTVIAAGLTPRRFAFGAACALEELAVERRAAELWSARPELARAALAEIWSGEGARPSSESARVLELIEAAEVPARRLHEGAAIDEVLDAVARH